MTKTELKEARERYDIMSRRIRELSAQNLIKESTEEQEKRIKNLLKPENYGDFFDYYFGYKSNLSLGDAKTPRFHIDDYIRLYNDPFIRQMRKKFRGGW